jgi:hypothetical protein
VEQGALIQVTSAELATGPAAIFMFDLARQGLVHLLGSDSHSARIGRPVRLSDGLERLAAVELTRPHIDWIARTAPRAIIRGQDVEPPFSPIAA